MISCTELTQMILPAARETVATTPRRRNSRTASRAHRNRPVRLTAVTVFHCSKLMVWNGASRCSPGIGDENGDDAELGNAAPEHLLHLGFVGDVPLMPGTPDTHAADRL